MVGFTGSYDFMILMSGAWEQTGVFALSLGDSFGYTFARHQNCLDCTKRCEVIEGDC